MHTGAYFLKMEDFFKHVEANRELYIERLREAVAIQSVSSDAARRNDCFRMVDYYMEKMKELNIDCEKRCLGMQSENLELPPVLLGRLGNDPAKPTICAYGHLDVQPAQMSDGWHTDPFELTLVPSTPEQDEQDGYGTVFPTGGHLLGRGSSDDKGPALSWLYVVEAYQKLNKELPCNLLFLVECMEESGSVGLDDVVVKEFAKDGYLFAADAICVTDNYWLSQKKPAVQYGLRGICYFFLEISGLAKDLHSGKFGGAVQEPMADLMSVLSTLVENSTGKILVPGVNDLVKPLTEEESKLYDGLEFDLDGLKQVAGAKDLLHKGSTKEALMHMWRFPSLSIHAVEGAHAAPGAKTVIPSKVIGKFSIRLVPDMQPDDVERMVRTHCEEVFNRLESPNSLNLYTEHGAPAFAGDPFDANYQAAKQANEIVYGVTPDFVRSGGSIPVTLTMQKTGRSVVLFPIGRGNDGAHGPNEKIDVNQYISGIKLIGAYLESYAKGNAK